MTVYSRSDWQADEKGLELSTLLQHGRINNEGYVNVADQLGISGERGMRPSLYFARFKSPFLIKS